MKTVELLKDVDYSLDGVKIKSASKGDVIPLPDDLADSLIAAEIAKETRKKAPPIETPEKPAE